MITLFNLLNCKCAIFEVRTVTWKKKSWLILCITILIYTFGDKKGAKYDSVDACTFRYVYSCDVYHLPQYLHYILMSRLMMKQINAY